MKRNTKKKKTPKKSDRIPSYWSRLRDALNKDILQSAEYKKNIKKGLPFFTKEELVKLEKKYSNGITWNEIDTELSKKGMIFKLATFRKYIQEQKIPKAIDYKATEKGKEAIYPKDTVRHINFVKYFYRIADNELIDKLLELSAIEDMTAKEAIEDRLDSHNLREGVFTYIRNMSSPGDDIEQAIWDVFDHDPDFMQEVESGLKDIYDTFNKKFEKWLKMLEQNKIQVPISE